MEQQNKSFFPKLMSILFIAMGIFLGVYAFFAHATSRDINGNTRDNANYLDSNFRSYNPSTGDIIDALYGSGDAGSIYTSGWNGYDSGTCLGTGGGEPEMVVEFTGTIPSPLVSRTIYVIDSGTYDITGIISLPSCTALISSGTVILSGDFTMIPPANPLLTAPNHENIVQNIQINSNTNQSNGMLIEGYNVTLKDFQAYDNKQTDGYGITLSGASYVNLASVDLHNDYNGLLGYAADHINASDTRLRENNESGLSGTFSRSVFSGMTIYNNNYGIYLYNTSRTTIQGSIHNNTVGGIFMYGGNTNTITDSSIYNNTGFGISIDSSSDIDINRCYLSGNLSTGIMLSNISNLTLDQLSFNDQTIFADEGTGYTFTTLGGNGLFTMFDPVDLFFDAYTKDNNYLRTNFSDVATLTGSTITSGLAFYMIAQELFVQDPDPTEGNDILLSGVSELLVGGDDRDGKIYRPIEITTGTKLGITGEAGMENISQIVNTVEVGSTGSILTMSGGTATIHFNISGVASGDTIAIRQSTDGDNRSENTPESVCALDSGDMCVFTTEGPLKLFSFGVPTDYSFTGMTETGDIVTSGGTYYAGIQIFFTGTNLSGATLNGNPYHSGDIISADADGYYIFILTDIGGNSTGMTFTIADTTPPLFTGTTLSGTTVINGGKYNTGVIIDFSDAHLSGATLNGIPYTSGTLITGDGDYTFYVEDTGGNHAGMIFIIDTTPPVFTGMTQGGTLVVSGGIYNTGITIIFSDDHLSGATLNGIPYTSGTLITGDNTYVFYVDDTAGNFTGMTFTIDKASPVFTGMTQGGSTIVSGGIYNTGITITFSDAHLSGATLNGNIYTGGTLITGDGSYVFVVSDLANNSTGISFSIDRTNPIVTGISPTSGLNITGGNTIAFLWSGSDANMSGYTLSLTGAGTYTISTVGTGYSITLVNGTYTRQVTATDHAGNTGTSTPATFMITTPLSGNATITGTNIQYNGLQAYTKDYVSLYLRTNQPTNYQITGDIALGTMTGTISGGMIISPYLTGIDGLKNISITFSTSGETVQKIISLYLDTTAPVPTLTSPTSGASVTGAFTLSRSAGADAVGITGYQYFISTTGTFATVIKSGFTTSTSTGILNGAFGTTGTFYRYVKALDKLGNSGTSAIQSFIYNTIIDTVPDTFSFTRVTSARLNRVYASNIVTIAGLSANTPVLASINRGVLYISGNMAGTTGYVQNGRTVKIELISSSDYDDEVTSTLTIGGVSATYRITTKTEEEANNNTDYSDISTNLSNTAKLQIIAIFEALRDLYSGIKKNEFFNSFLVMIQSKIDDLGTSSDDTNRREALEYLHDLADQYGGEGGTSSNDIENTSRIVNGVYTAPNGKRYTITYDSAKEQFTSSNFLTPKYFPTLDVLRYTIDINNPVGSQYATAKPIKARWGRIALDGTRQTSPYTAPNHKVFYFFKTMEGRYSSYTFTVEKYFDSLEAVKEYIYNSNR